MLLKSRFDLALQSVADTLVFGGLRAVAGGDGFVGGGMVTGAHSLAGLLELP